MVKENIPDTLKVGTCSGFPRCVGMGVLRGDATRSGIGNGASLVHG
jgi:hypothetical protein